MNELNETRCQPEHAVNRIAKLKAEKKLLRKRIAELEAEVKRLRWYERCWNQRDYLPDAAEEER